MANNLRQLNTPGALAVSDTEDSDSTSETEDNPFEEDPFEVEDATDDEEATQVLLPATRGPAEGGFVVQAPPSSNNRGKDGTVWSAHTTASSRGRPAAQNIMTVLPGPQGPARAAITPLQMWECFFTDEVLEVIVVHTNEEIERRQQRYTEDARYVQLTDLIELKAFIGLLYLAGLQKASKRSISEFYSAFAPPIFKLTMSEARMRFLLQMVRFDDKATRDQRKAGHQRRLAPIHKIWTYVNDRCITLYKPSAEVTVDEQLLPFRGRAPFRIYMPAKPDKYGLEILALCDAKTAYRVNGIIYEGKGTTPPNVPQAEYYPNCLARSRSWEVR